MLRRQGAIRKQKTQINDNTRDKIWFIGVVERTKKNIQIIYKINALKL